LRKVGRNENCPCGSGKKYKNCCLKKKEAQDLESSHKNVVSDELSNEKREPAQLGGLSAQIQNIFGRGCHQLERNEYELAAKSFTSVLRIDQNHYQALTGLGRCLLELGRQEEARRCFQKALEIKPDYAQARLNLDFIPQSTRHPQTKQSL